MSEFAQKSKTQLKQRRFTPPNGTQSLASFQVRGWVRVDETIKVEGRSVTVTKRVPLSKVQIISAVDGFAAAQQYARTFRIPDVAWMDTEYDRKPFCIIRTSALGEREP